MLLQSFVDALAMLLRPEIWIWIIGGSIVGIAFGIIPGLSALIGLTLLLPFVFLMSPEQALPFCMAMSAVGYTGGAITAILINIPGTNPNAATVLDGYPMTQKGQGARAIGAAMAGSAMGGVFSVILALIMIPMIMPIIFSIRSADMVFLIFMGLSFVAILGRGSALKGMIAGGFGMLLAFVGMHVISGAPRFTLGSMYLRDGIPLVPAVLGLFSLPEMVALASTGGTIAGVKGLVLDRRQAWQGVLDVFRHWGLWLRSSIIGYIVGIIPGIGGVTAVFVAYGQAKQTSRHPELYGTGIIEGVIAPESANNAKEGGALLTTLALGIPGSSEMVVFLGILMMLNLIPGPDMLTKHLTLSFNMLDVLFIANVIGAVICFLLAVRMAKIATVPYYYLVPAVTVVVFIGAYANNSQYNDLMVLLFFGLVGLAMKKFDFNRPALVVGLVLGDLFEKYLFISVEGAGPMFWLRPISLVIIALTVGLFVYIPLRDRLEKKPRAGVSA